LSATIFTLDEPTGQNNVFLEGVPLFCPLVRGDPFHPVARISVTKY